MTLGELEGCHRFRQQHSNERERWSRHIGNKSVPKDDPLIVRPPETINLS